MIRKKHLLISSLAIALTFTFVLTGCGKKGADPEAPDSGSEEKVVEEKDYLSVETSIYYSAGDDNNWVYGNQRKEFPNNEACYARIGSTAITTGAFSKGVGDEITVTYRFTGAKNCKIEISDGRATQVETTDSNVIEYMRIITAEKEKNAKEDFMIFRYLPNNAEKVVLEVIYDDQIAEKYEELNTIYFKISD